jgi:hypothetical protein
MHGKSMFQFLIFEIRIFQTTSDAEMTKTKIVDLKKLWNFVVVVKGLCHIIYCVASNSKQVLC